MCDDLRSVLLRAATTPALARHRLQHFQRVMRAGFRLKAILTAEVYRKVGRRCCSWSAMSQ
jgi:hypothetical protein